MIRKKLNRRFVWPDSGAGITVTKVQFPASHTEDIRQ